MNASQLHRLLDALDAAGVDLDVESTLDALWLAARTGDERAIAITAATDAVGDAAARSPAALTQSGDASRREAANRADSTRIGTERLDSVQSRSAARLRHQTTGARGVTLARAAAIPERRELIRSLRPLRRRVTSPGVGVLDVDTTVRRAAEEVVWLPAFEPARERWLDVMLVADHGLSMILWKDTIDEFERVLRTSGAFRSVRSWWLQSDASSPLISARGRGQAPSSAERLTRLTRGEGRSVILLLSDCVGARWHDGAIPRLIDGWSQSTPVALVQVTPEWFWSRTAMRDTVPTRLRGVLPAAVNRRWRWDLTHVGALADGDDAALLRVPAVKLTADGVSQIASLVAGVGRMWSPGAVFDLTWDGADAEEPAPAVSADDRVARFRTLASPAALRLASAFAASPVRSLGVLRLLRRDLLHEASPFVEAEVLLGGVLRVRREDASWQSGGGLPLEFVPGVQSLLLNSALAGDVLHVLEVAASQAKEGVVSTFTSWLREPGSGVGQLNPEASAFAAEAAIALERLGGAHANVVRRVPAAIADEVRADEVFDNTFAQNISSQANVGIASEAEAQVEAGAEATAEQADAPAAWWSGGPHHLPLPEPLVGRAQECEYLLWWIHEPSNKDSHFLRGKPGIGKSALAAYAVHRWRERWPGYEAFVWSFALDASAAAAAHALLRFFTGNAASAQSNEQEGESDVFERLHRALVQEKGPILIVLDALDALDATTDIFASALTEVVLKRLMRQTEGLSPYLLLTVRMDSPLAERMSSYGGLEELAPLDSAHVDELVDAYFGMQRAAGSFPIPEDVAATKQLVRCAGGNLHLVQRLYEAGIEFTPSALLQELELDINSATTELSSEWILQTLDGIRRARGFAQAGAAAEYGGDIANAIAAFDEEIRLRAALPSRRLRARSLQRRGLLLAMQEEYTSAVADLTAAVEHYRSVSATDELESALRELADFRSALGHRSVHAIFEITGRVSGVGFRSFVQHLCTELGISGSAQNLPDGRIRVEVTGPATRLAELEARLRVGPPAARVEHVVRIESNADADANVKEGSASSANPSQQRRPWRDDGRDRAVVAIGVGNIDLSPELRAAANSAKRVAEWARRSQGIPSENVLLLTDEREPVSFAAVREGLMSLLEQNPMRQLIIYFAGFARHVQREEVLLLSGVLRDAEEAIDVAAMIDWVRRTGVEHTVIVTDSVRVAADAIGATRSPGSRFSSIAGRAPTLGVVDRFMSAAVGRAAVEPEGMFDAAQLFDGNYTEALLGVLRGEGRVQIDQHDGHAYLTAHALERYLRDIGPELRRRTGRSDEWLLPASIVESGKEHWIARIPMPQSAA